MWQPAQLQQHHQSEHLLKGLGLSKPFAAAAGARACHCATRCSNQSVQPFKPCPSSGSSEAIAGCLQYMIAARSLFNAVVAGGALDDTSLPSVLLQALVGLLLANLSLVLLAALVAMPLHIAFSAPLVPACIALQRRAPFLCNDTIQDLPCCSLLALRTVSTIRTNLQHTAAG